MSFEILKTKGKSSWGSKATGVRKHEKDPGALYITPLDQTNKNLDI
jgi:hypothetical protein